MPRANSRIDAAALQGRVWTPASLAPALWVDFFDLGSLTLNGGLIYGARDKAKRNDPANASATAPSLVRDVGGGDFFFAQFGTSKYLQLPSSVSITQAGVTFVCVAKPTDTSAYQRILSETEAAGNYGFWVSGGTKFWLYTAVGLLTSAFTNGTWRMWTITASAGSLSQWLDGTAGSGGSDTFSLPLITLGGAGAGTSYSFSGGIAGMCLLPYAANQTDLRRLEGYFAHQLKLTSLLPASHPYRNMPPIVGPA